MFVLLPTSLELSNLGDRFRQKNARELLPCCLVGHGDLPIFVELEKGIQVELVEADVEHFQSLLIA